MPIRRRVGYDFQNLYSRHELEEMYLNEGFDSEEAVEKAAKMYTVLGTMARKERRLWKTIREHELIAGFNDSYMDLIAV